jgi:hypothetical protein
MYTFVRSTGPFDAFYTSSSKTQTTQPFIGLPTNTYSKWFNEYRQVPLIYKNEREFAFHRVSQAQSDSDHNTNPNPHSEWHQVVEASERMVS